MVSGIGGSWLRRCSESLRAFELTHVLPSQLGDARKADTSGRPTRIRSICGGTSWPLVRSIPGGSWPSKLEVGYPRSPRTSN